MWRACPVCSAGSDRPRGAARATRWGLRRRRGLDGPPATRSHSPGTLSHRHVPRGPRPVPLQAPQTCCSFRLERLSSLRTCPPAAALGSPPACHGGRRTSSGRLSLRPPWTHVPGDTPPWHPVMLPSLAKPPFAVPGHVLNGRLPHWAATPTGAVSLLAHRGSPNFARACHAIVRGHTEAGQRAGQPGGSGGAPPGPGPPPRPPPAE